MSFCHYRKMILSQSGNESVEPFDLRFPKKGKTAYPHEQPFNYCPNADGGLNNIIHLCRILMLVNATWSPVSAAYTSLPPSLIVILSVRDNPKFSVISVIFSASRLKVTLQSNPSLLYCFQASHPLKSSLLFTIRPLSVLPSSSHDSPSILMSSYS